MTSFESQEGRLTCRKLIIMQVIALALISIVMKPDFVDIRLIGLTGIHTQKSLIHLNAVLGPSRFCCSPSACGSLCSPLFLSLFLTWPAWCAMSTLKLSLSMFAWDNEDVLPVSLVRRSSGVVPGLARPGQVDTL